MVPNRTSVSLFIAVSLLALVCALTHQSSIERDIRERVQLALQSNPELRQIEVAAVDGRDVVLSGDLGTTALSESAVRTARRIDGVRFVRSEIRVTAVEPLRRSSLPPAAPAPATRRPGPSDSPSAGPPEPPRELLSLLGEARVEFEVGSAELTAPDRVVLDEIASRLASVPGWRVEISGHTDDTGSEELNRDLSLRRAETVLRYLSSTVDAERLSVLGYGADRPRADNSTETGRQRNRRIEFRLAASEEEER